MHLLKEELQNECRGSPFTFLADPSMSISLPADRSVMCSLGMLQPLWEYDVGLGMLQQCSTLGCGAPDSQESSVVISAAHKRLENFQPQYSNPN